MNRRLLQEVIFEAETPAGKAFDVALLIAIVLSVLAVIFESVDSIRLVFGEALRAFEWGVTVVFTVEYLLRLYVVRRPMKYAFSFFGIVDLLAILPTYLGLVFVGTHSLVVIRALRLLRIFRVLKLVQLLGAAQALGKALKSSRDKIFVFLFSVVTLVVILGTVMYLVESGTPGFGSIPSSMYWAIVTLTTVGYGDIAPVSVLGKLIASVVMVIGYAIIAVPTGIVTAEIVKGVKGGVSTEACPSCSAEGHRDGAGFCFRCGERL